MLRSLDLGDWFGNVGVRSLLQYDLVEKCDRFYSMAWLRNAIALRYGLNSKCDKPKALRFAYRATLN
ncbi:hypothetical protein [Calothrix sp. PCC 7507]|uniref:hypothetical protein n=1 Tax=Calothrix sp. PCC 7507 TaxID=99598 RepID=UPI0002F78035|nr:hypothetical protein [Calothrix sp. PCC 7507]